MSNTDFFGLATLIFVAQTQSKLTCASLAVAFAAVTVFSRIYQ